MPIADVMTRPGVTDEVRAVNLNPPRLGHGLEKPLYPNTDSSGRVKYVLTVRDDDLGPIQAGGSFNVLVSGLYGSRFHQLEVVASRGRLQTPPGDPALRAGTCHGLSAVTNTDNRTKNTVSFTWVAPDERLPDGECVTIRAAVVDEKQFLYQNDGGLTVQLCASLKQINLTRPNTTKPYRATVSTTKSSLRNLPIPSSATRPKSVYSLQNKDEKSGEKKGIHSYEVQKSPESVATASTQLSDFLTREMFQSANGGHRTDKGTTQPRARRFRKEKLLNILVRNRRESPSTRTDLATTIEDDRSLKWRLISKACCRSGSRFGNKPHVTDCDEASRKFVSRNIAELTHLRAVCVDEFAFCCKEKQREGGYLIESSEDQPTEPLDGSTGQQSAMAVSYTPTGATSSTTAEKEISIQHACCLNGLRTAYDSGKSCFDEGESYANQTNADELESANAATACMVEFSRCCEVLREHVESVEGSSSRPPQADLATLQDLQLTQHCCRQGSVEGLSPEADCEHSAVDYARLPLRNSTDRQLQCSSKYTECCSARQADNENLVALIYPSIHHTKTLKAASPFSNNQTGDDVQSPGTDFDSIIERILLGPQVANVLQSTTTPLGTGEQGTSQTALSNFDGHDNDKIQPVTELHNPDQLAEGPTTVPLRTATEAHMSQSIIDRSSKPTGSPNPPAHRSQSQLSWYDIGTDTLVVLSKHRRTLRLCCLQGKAVDIDSDHPNSCHLDADSYTMGARLTDQVKQSCKDVFVHCCESMDPGHRGTSLTRSSVRNIRRLLSYSGEHVSRSRERSYR
ncbi:Hypp8877 [Branchiostoma lanceolatum]|uniref:Hypp8877 protein n=1 Tax=Branchiostoma lanceolatum TaxID=7740 RepID=A0A8J9Z9V6_BRALA|nr:Hypp8877 [Branchiostoma lanceolatum]